MRLPEVREAQAQLAGRYGIGGFCYYYHYWFNGKRLLERPFSEVESPCCWYTGASSCWTKRELQISGARKPAANVSATFTWHE